MTGDLPCPSVPDPGPIPAELVQRWGYDLASHFLRGTDLHCFLKVTDPQCKDWTRHLLAQASAHVEDYVRYNVHSSDLSRAAVLSSSAVQAIERRILCWTFPHGLRQSDLASLLEPLTWARETIERRKAAQEAVFEDLRNELRRRQRAQTPWTQVMDYTDELATGPTASQRGRSNSPTRMNERPSSTRTRPRVRSRRRRKEQPTVVASPTSSENLRSELQQSNSFSGRKKLITRVGPPILIIGDLNFTRFPFHMEPFRTLCLNGLTVSEADLWVRSNNPCSKGVAVIALGMGLNTPADATESQLQDDFCRLRQALSRFFPGIPVLAIRNPAEKRTGADREASERANRVAKRLFQMVPVPQTTRQQGELYKAEERRMVAGRIIQKVQRLCPNLRDIKARPWVRVTPNQKQQ